MRLLVSRKRSRIAIRFMRVLDAKLLASWPQPSVSWGAITAGAAAAASLSLILLILGVVIGLSSVSPWARDSVSATTFGVSTILW
jgi:hypothetical protein